MMPTRDNQSYILEKIDFEGIIKFVNQSLINQYKELEPVPQISPIEINNIRDVIYRSLAVYSNTESYGTFSKKIAFIFYSIVKGHYLQNGNKRTAAGVVTMLISICVDNIYNNDEEFIDSFFISAAETAIYIAESNANDSKEVIQYVESWVRKYIDAQN